MTPTRGASAAPPAREISDWLASVARPRSTSLRPTLAALSQSTTTRRGAANAPPPRCRDRRSGRARQQRPQLGDVVLHAAADDAECLGLRLAGELREVAHVAERLIERLLDQLAGLGRV